MKDSGDSLRELLAHLRESFELLELPVELRRTTALVDSIGRARPVRIVVVGEFNSGKSTLVNALCGANMLPAGIIPTTATINIVQFSPTPGLVVIYTDGNKKDLPFAPDTLQQFTARSGDQREIREIRVSIPNLPPDLVLIDTPGVNDINQTRSEIVYEMLPEADAVVFLMDIQQPLKRSEVEFLRSRILGATIVKTIFVLNHIDRVSNVNEISAAVDYVRTGLRAIYTEIADSLARAGSEQLSSELRRADIPIFTVSAKRMLRSSSETVVEGDPQGLRTEILRLVAPETQMQTVWSGMVGQALGLIQRLRREVDERSAMQGAEHERTLTELRRHTEVLRNTLRATEQALNKVDSQRNVLKGKADSAVEGVFSEASAVVSTRLESNGPEKGLQIIQQEIARNLEGRVATLNEQIQRLALESTRQASTFIHVSSSSPKIEIANSEPGEQHADWLEKMLTDPVNGAAFWVLGSAIPFIFGPIGFVVLALPFVARLFGNNSSQVSVEQIQTQIAKCGKEVRARICATVDERLDTISAAILDAMDEPQQRIRIGCALLNGEKGIPLKALDSLSSRAVLLGAELTSTTASLAMTGSNGPLRQLTAIGKHSVDRS